MRCACIDIGSNTTRLLVAEPSGAGVAAVLEQRVFTRLGRSLDAGGQLPEETIARVAAVVAAQRAAAEAAGATRLRVVATAAIRRAGNRDALLAALRERAGVEAEILSGEEEARLAFAGATRALHPVPPGRIAVVDVGGLSTEIAVGTPDGGVEWATSFAVGSSGLSARSRSDPPSAADVAAMRAAAAAAFGGGRIPAAGHAVAVGGSAASLPTLVGPRLDGPAIERALRVLCASPAAEVARAHGLAPERTQLLPAGILVLEAAARELGRPLEIGCGGLREGVILALSAKE